MGTLRTIQSHLRTFHDTAPSGTKGTLLASSDGFLVAHTLPSGDAERVAAMVATTTGVSRRMCDTLDAGGLTATTIAGDEEQVLLYTLGTVGVLAVLARSDANVALLNMNARDAVDTLRSALTSSTESSEAKAPSGDGAVATPTLA